MHDDCHVVNLDDWVKGGIEKEAGQYDFMASLCFFSVFFFFFDLNSTDIWICKIEAG